MKLCASVRNFQWFEVKQPVGIANRHPLGAVLLELYCDAETRRELHLLMSPEEAAVPGWRVIEAAEKNHKTRKTLHISTYSRARRVLVHWKSQRSVDHRGNYV